MMKAYHCNRKTLTLRTERETPDAALLINPRTGRYYIDFFDGTDEVEPLGYPDDFDNAVYLWKRAGLSMIAYRVETVFLGTDAPSEFYYSDKEKAWAFFNAECENGGVCDVTITGMSELPYEGCSWYDIVGRGGEVY